MMPVRIVSALENLVVDTLWATSGTSNRWQEAKDYEPLLVGRAEHPTGMG